MNKYLMASILLDYHHESIQNLIEKNNWHTATPLVKIQSIYNYVKDEIKFGYNERDDLKASVVLEQGYGQCNTKSILLMALLRSVGIPNRTHGFYIDKTMQKGALNGLTYFLAPKKITHAYVEVYYDDQWLSLEGVIPDKVYFDAVKNKTKYNTNGYYGYAIAIKDLASDLYFKGKDTFSQNLAITHDLGIYDTPDLFFLEYNNRPSILKQCLFKNYLSKKLNNRLNRIRKTGK